MGASDSEKGHTGAPLETMHQDHNIAEAPSRWEGHLSARASTHLPVSGALPGGAGLDATCSVLQIEDSQNLTVRFNGQDHISIVLKEIRLSLAIPIDDARAFIKHGETSLADAA